jgi:hypothetical protein
METVYEYENWLNPALAAAQLAEVMSYWPLLVIAAAPASVVFYCEEDAYEGEWVAVLCREGQIGVVDGYFGSCSGCDELQKTNSPEDVYALAEMYLSSVRSFLAQLVEFAELGLEVRAAELFCVLRNENPEMPVREVVELAGLLAGEAVPR